MFYCNDCDIWTDAVLITPISLFIPPIVSNWDIVHGTMTAKLVLAQDTRGCVVRARVCARERAREGPGCLSDEISDPAAVSTNSIRPKTQNTCSEILRQ